MIQAGGSAPSPPAGGSLDGSFQSSVYGGGGGGAGGNGGGAGGSILLAGSSVTMGNLLVAATGSIAHSGGLGGNGAYTGSCLGAGATSPGYPGLGAACSSGMGGGGGGAGGNGTVGGDGRIHVTTASYSGTTLPAADVSSSNGYNYGNPTWEDEGMCVSGKCLLYNGSTDSSVIPNANPIDLDQHLASGFTIEAWVKVISDGEGHVGRIISKGTNTYIRVTNQGSDGLADLEASLDLSTSAATYAAVNAITLNKWHHITMGYTDDGDDEITLYIDGKLSGSSSNGSGSPITDSTDLSIGGITGSHFNGFIDEVKVYKQERTSTQVKTDILKVTSPEGVSVAFNPTSLSSLSDGLIGYWKMDETAANTCNGSTNDNCDSSGNNKPGDWYGNVASTAGKFGRGTIFDGNGDYIDMGNNFDVGAADSFTISTWFMRTQTNLAGNVYSKQAMDQTAGYKLYVSDDGSNNIPSFLITDTSNNYFYIEGGTTKVPNRWYNVTATLNRSIKKAFLYVDGVKVAEQDISTIGSLSNSIDFALGVQSPGVSNYFPFSGSIDETRFYNRALSDAEVLQLYKYAPGPVAYWNLDEGKGSTAYDSSGNGNNSTTWAGNPTYTQGKFGSGVNFDGTRQSIRFAESATIDIGGTNDSYTVSAWLKTPITLNSANGTIINKRSSGGAYPFDIYLSSGNPVVFNISDGTHEPVAETAINYVLPNQWYYITGVRDVLTDKIYLYVNGVLVSSSTDTTVGAITNNQDVSIASEGNSYDGNYFKGTVDDVKIYNYARTADQIVSDMNAGHPAPGSPVGSASGSWQFEEGYGDTTHDTSINNATGDLGGTTYTCPGGSGCPTWTKSGKTGNALSFDGGDYIDTADTPFDISGDWTISSWVNRNNNTGSQSIVSKRGADGSGGFSLAVGGSGEVYCQTDNGATVDSSYTATGLVTASSGWVQLIATRSGTSCDVYVNGVNKTATRATHTTLGLNNAPLRIGANTQGSDYFRGIIDEIKVYNFSLTADQAAVESNSGTAQKIGSISTGSTGTPDNSSNAKYCLPGDATSCAAPVGEWNMDENRGLTVYDTSGNGNDLTLQNGGGSLLPKWTPGRIGASLDFNDKNILYKSPVTSNLNILGDMTVESWIYRNSTTTDDVIITQKGTGAGSIGNTNFMFAALKTTNYLALYWQYGSEVFETGGMGDTALSNPSGKWVHVAAVRDAAANTVIFYENGVKLGSTMSYTNDPTDGATTPRTIIGSNGPTPSTVDDTFGGKIDNLVVYNYKRTPAQIAWDYNKGAPIAQYDFNECSGAIVHDTALKSDRNVTPLNGSIVPGGGTQSSVGNCTTSAQTMWYNGRSGKYNGSLNFDGSDDYVTIPDPGTASALDFPTEFSVSAWFNLSDLGTGGKAIIAKGATLASGDANYILNTSASPNQDELTCGFFNSTIYTGITTGIEGAQINLQTGNWYHVVCTFKYVGPSANDVNMYINGKLAAQNLNFGASPPVGNDALYLGGLPGSNNFSGQIDSVKVYNYELTPTQVNNLYNASSAVQFAQ